MSMNPDATVAIRPFDDDPFAYGDQTVLQLRTATFDVPAEAPEPEPAFGTVMMPVPPVEEDPIVRIEQKLDLALRQITALQQRLESLDTTLMRVLMSR
jgi:hypothetical protein